MRNNRSGKPCTNLPRFPRRSSAGPEFFQPLFVSQCVHRLPEATMKIGLHLLFQSEVLHRFSFEHRRIIANLIQDRRGQNKEPSVDPSSLALWFLLECGNGGPFDAQSAESSRWLHRRHGYTAAMTPVESNGCRNIDIAYTIPV